MTASERRDESVGPAPAGEFRYTVVHFLITLVVVAVLALLPLLLFDALDTFGDPVGHVYGVPASGDAGDAVYRVHIDITEFDDVGSTMTVIASAARRCAPDCPESIQIALRSLNPAEGAPPVPVEDRIVFDPSMETASKETVLPVSGNALGYPFDLWRLVLEAVVVQASPDAATGGTPDAAGAVALTVQSRLSRIAMHPASGSANGVAAGPPTTGRVATVLEFERPMYVKGMIVEVVLLTAAIAACVVFLTPVNALIASAVGLVLAVWGVRGILLGTLTPAASAVDAALSLVVIFVLIATMTRILWLFETRSRVRVLRRLPATGKPGPPPRPEGSKPALGDFVPAGSWPELSHAGSGWRAASR